MDQQYKEDKKKYGLFYTLTFFLSVHSFCTFANEHFILLKVNQFGFLYSVEHWQICIKHNLAVNFGVDFSY